MRKYSLGLAAVALAGVLWLTGGHLLAEEDDRQAELDRKLIETLSGATLVGSFTVTGREDGGQPREERYEIREVEKLQGNLFLFRVRIQYGDRDINAAAPLVVIWSGDTPVITLTNAPIPGVGRYTARVLIYEDHYAGYWSAGEDGPGGHLFGVVERDEDEDAEDADAEDDA